MSNWGVYQGEINVVAPLNDSRPHDLTYELEDGDLTLHCWCHPDYSDGLIVHHSADGREDMERIQ